MANSHNHDSVVLHFNKSGGHFIQGRRALEYTTDPKCICAGIYTVSILHFCQNYERVYFWNIHKKSSPTSGGRSVGIIPWWSKAPEIRYKKLSLEFPSNMWSDGKNCESRIVISVVLKLYLQCYLNLLNQIQEHVHHPFGLLSSFSLLHNSTSSKVAQGAGSGIEQIK
jgi:hypothetical protein